jgi:hypothetical protein
VRRCGLDLTGSEQGPVVVSCEHSNEPFGSINSGGNFLIIVEYFFHNQILPEKALSSHSGHFRGSLKL